MTFDILKIVELIKDPDLRMKIAQLYEENISLKEENHKLREKLNDKRKIEELNSKLKHENNHYYLDTDGPFCTNCWDSNNKLIRLHEGSPTNGQRFFTCPNCKTYTHLGEYIQPEVGGVNWGI